MSQTASDLPSHPRLPSLPHPDHPESLQFCFQHLADALLHPPDGARCLAHPGMCPVSHPAGSPPAPGCSPASPSWDSRGPQQPAFPLPRLHSPPLQTVTQHHLLLEALPALHMPTALQTHYPGRLGALRRTGQKHQPGTGQALGEHFMNEQNRIQRLKQKKRRLCTNSLSSGPHVSHRVRHCGQGVKALGETSRQFTFPPSSDTFPFRSSPGLVKPCHKWV